MTAPTEDNAVTVGEDGTVTDEQAAELMSQMADLENEGGVPQVEEQPEDTEPGVPAPDPQPPQAVTVTEFFLAHFVHVHNVFKTQFGKTTVKPEYLFAVMSEAAKYASLYTNIEIQKIEQQRQEAQNQ